MEKIMIKDEQIVYNACRTPDGTVIESTHRHDYITHLDKNGETYMRDGGQDYIRASINKEKAEDLSLTMGDGHAKVREVVKWGTYGKNGDEPLHYIPVSEMTTEHIQAVLENVFGIAPWREQVFIDEIQYREDSKRGR